MRKYSSEFIQCDNKKLKEENRNLAWYLTTHITLYIVLFFFLIFFAWYTVFITTHRFYAVYNISMKGTLNSKIADDEIDPSKISYDAVYINKLDQARIFDIVVVQNKDSSAVKRLLAEAGDYITIAKTENDEYAFYRIPKGSDLSTYTDEMARVDETSGVNGYTIYSSEQWWEERDKAQISTISEISDVEYEDKFFNRFIANREQYQTHISENGMIYVQVPEGKVFFMGDNRARSTDCREKGFEDKEKIVGRTEFIVYDYNFANRLLEVVKFYFKQMEEFFAR
ncbi:MAG: hypothetical protein E7375_01630 [Clostridiales bacterium]|nr:hypothetical protein [Clostridiales bacterium]